MTSKTSGTEVAASEWYRPARKSWEPGEDAAAVVVDSVALPCTSSLRLADLAAEHLDDRLVAEADAERRDAARQALDDRGRRARLLGAAGPGGNDEVGGGELVRLVRRNLVVPSDDHLAPSSPNRCARL